MSESDRGEFYKKIVSSQRTRLKILKVLEFLPDSLMVRLQYFVKFGRFLSLKRPRRFTEKLQWYKLFYRDSRMADCADKVLVKSYVSEAGFENILIPTLATYTSSSEFSLDSLPDQFVLKLNVGAQNNLIVKDKNQFSEESIKALVDSWLSAPVGKLGREWAYYNIKPLVLAESYLPSDSNGDLIDYKFFCFYGEPKFLYVLKDRFSHKGLKLGVFDLDFKQLRRFRSDIEPLIEPVSRPENFEKMIEIARSLSAPFPHVRVDLYNVDGEIYFGELTFYDGSGYFKTDPDFFDFEIGDMFDLPEIK